MSEFFASYGGTLIVGGIVLAVVALIVARLVKDKRAGKHCCGGDCCNCRGCSPEATSRAVRGTFPRKREFGGDSRR